MRNMETRIIVPVAAVVLLYVLTGLTGRKSPGLVLILRFSDQEETVEGFLRKIAWWAACTDRRVELVVLVDASRDLTETIVGRLARELGLRVDGRLDPDRPGTRCFDARRLSGGQLARVCVPTLLAA